MLNKKKLIAFAVATVTILSTSITAFAFTHSDDKWNYGPETNIFNWSQQRQYSNFYCSQQNHHGTAVIAGQDNIVHTYRVDKGAGYWANATTNWESDATQWNSYYGHD